jgi:hypothetical protein
MTRLALCILALTGSAATAFAQTPLPSPLARGDVTGVVGWQHVNKSDLLGDGGNDWHNRGVYGGGTVGWFWTDHHKMEVEFGASNRARFQTYETQFINNVPVAGRSVYSFSTRRVAIGEQYQFFRNQWFHPHAAAGVDLTWETITETAEPLFVFTQPGGPRQIRPGIVTGPDTSFRARPFGEVGFKAYVTPHGFFRGDFRVMVRSGIDEAQMRFGFGVDF